MDFLYRMDLLPSTSGFGFWFGGGFEFSPHWNVALDLVYSHITEFGVDLNSYGLRLTINGLYY